MTLGVITSTQAQTWTVKHSTARLNDSTYVLNVTVQTENKDTLSVSMFSAPQQQSVIKQFAFWIKGKVDSVYSDTFIFHNSVLTVEAYGEICDKNYNELIALVVKPYPDPPKDVVSIFKPGTSLDLTDNGSQGTFVYAIYGKNVDMHVEWKDPSGVILLDTSISYYEADSFRKSSFTFFELKPGDHVVHLTANDDSHFSRGTVLDKSSVKDLLRGEVSPDKIKIYDIQGRYFGNDINLIYANKTYFISEFRNGNVSVRRLVISEP